MNISKRWFSLSILIAVLMAVLVSCPGQTTPPDNTDTAKFDTAKFDTAKFGP